MDRNPRVPELVLLAGLHVSVQGLHGQLVTRCSPWSFQRRLPSLRSRRFADFRTRSRSARVSITCSAGAGSADG